MNDKVIRFGTDGWRGIIADDFTFENVKVVTQGVCEYLEHKAETKRQKPRVVIGYDTRFLSERFARAAAGVLAANGVSAVVSNKVVPTPVLSYGVVNRDADLGIMITASHNPYCYNGFKIKGPFGGSADMDIISKIEKRVQKGINDGLFYRCLDESSGDVKDIRYEDFIADYKKHIFSLIDMEAAASHGFSLLLDPMYGASQGIYKAIMEELKPKKLVEIHGQPNPGFGNISPEPIGENLGDAVSKLKAEGLDMAICLDGDADRIGALDSSGNYISSHHIFAVVLLHLAEDRKLKGRVVKTVSTSSVIDRICREYSLELKTTPIGFKYIGKEILDGGVIMGGEESGGLWCYGNIPERDGMLMGLKLVEICSLHKKPISRILDSLYERFGYFAYQRKDYHITLKQKENLISELKRGVPGPIGDLGIDKVVTIDGYKYITADGSWIMIRPSGTEAVVRVYAESSSQDKLDSLHRLGKKVIDGIMG
ncbi:MAG: phosphoglucomutase/phosphomannomutase family protein [Actinomycetota bacterium]